LGCRDRNRDYRRNFNALRFDEGTITFQPVADLLTVIAGQDFRNTLKQKFLRRLPRITDKRTV